MKTAFIILLSALCFTAMANQKKETKNPIVGSWKFSNKTKTNDFQKVFDKNQTLNVKTEYLTFESNSKFKHEFLDKDGNLLRTLKGKWKSVGDKIKIEYSDVEYDLMINYFFLEDNLVLGQNFNHVIFTKDNIENNVTMK